MRALLYRTARNLVIDQHRRAVHRQHDDIDALAEVEQPLAPRHLQPDEILAYEQQARALVAAIESLPPRCREAFVLNRFEGLAHQEVAERMGISKNMVAQHVARGILTCQACLDHMTGNRGNPGSTRK
jgi:RNA polymerase sigma-70 factor (ECF subfamily)